MSMTESSDEIMVAVGKKTLSFYKSLVFDDILYLTHNMAVIQPSFFHAQNVICIENYHLLPKNYGEKWHKFSLL